MNNSLSLHARSAFIILALLSTCYLAHKHSIHHRALSFLYQYQMSAKDQRQAISLHHYQAVVQAKNIINIDQLSGLTYNSDSNTLFAINDTPSEIIEMNLTGDVLRHIYLNDFEDTEGLTYIGDNTYALLEENNNRINFINIDQQNNSYVHSFSDSVSLDFHPTSKDGYEGIAFNQLTNALVLIKESKPLIGYEVLGFVKPSTDGFGVKKLDYFNSMNLLIKDMSSLHHDRTSKNTLVLSDESRRVVEINNKGEPISTLSLTKGMHQLSARIPQAEGITMDKEGNIYIISEPNLFYKFSKQISDTTDTQLASNDINQSHLQ